MGYLLIGILIPFCYVRSGNAMRAECLRVLRHELEGMALR